MNAILTATAGLTGSGNIYLQAITLLVIIVNVLAIVLVIDSGSTPATTRPVRPFGIKVVIGAKLLGVLYALAMSLLGLVQGTLGYLGITVIVAYLAIQLALAYGLYQGRYLARYAQLVIWVLEIILIGAGFYFLGPLEAAIAVAAKICFLIYFYTLPVRSFYGNPAGRMSKVAGKGLVYEILVFGAFIMLVPFYWMVVTSFKDGQTAAAFPPVWSPSRIQTTAPDPQTGDYIPVVRLETIRGEEDIARVVPESDFAFRRVEDMGVRIMREMPIPDRVFDVQDRLLQQSNVINLDLRNFQRAWYMPEQTSLGQVNFLTYFIVSIVTSFCSTAGALTTAALAAFAFARLEFFGKTYLFYIILATMMVPGQVLLIPNFLILSELRMLDTYGALIVPWLASVFAIFLMRQFFMTIPEDLWDAARIDGASRFRYLWQVVVPLSKPVFITAGIFDFLSNWNSLLWPLIVTSTPSRRTLMVGLQNLSDDAGAEFHILMAASCLAIFPVVIAFFFLQRFFIEGIARTGIK